MDFIEGFKIALQSLWANKLRSILTLLGVVIGVASVITVVTLVNGAKQFVTTKLNSYGAEVVTISKMPQTFITIEEYLEFQKRKDIKLDDYEAVRDECKSCVSVGALRNTTGKIVYGTKSSTDTDIRGWTWTMPPMCGLIFSMWTTLMTSPLPGVSKLRKLIVAARGSGSLQNY